MPNELKPEDVMRALECHCTERKFPLIGEDLCEKNCPYFREDFCVQILVRDALALLREKDAEIERLRMELKGETDG